MCVYVNQLDYVESVTWPFVEERNLDLADCASNLAVSDFISSFNSCGLDYSMLLQTAKQQHIVTCYINYYGQKYCVDTYFQFYGSYPPR